MPMAVKLVEPAGSATMIFLTYMRQDITAGFRERHSFAPGEVINLRPDPAHLRLFDAGTGQRLAAKPRKEMENAQGN